MRRTLTSLALLSFLALVWATPARAAGTPEDEAEHVRLSEDMKRLSRRNAWRGVEDAYVKLLDLQSRGVQLAFEDHMMGADAATALGDISAAYDRLQRAIAFKPDEEVAQRIAAIDAAFGKVTIDVESKFVGTFDLKPVEMPFAADQRNAITQAQAALAENRTYQGLLPYGTYTVGPKHFTLAQDKGPVAITLTQADGVQRARGVAFVGPRVDIGAAFTAASQPSFQGGQLAPDAFAGPGARAGIGVQVGFESGLGGLVEVGYHGMFGGKPDVAANPSYQLTNSDIHLGYGWLAGAYRKGGLDIALGPVLGMGAAKATGLGTYCASGTCSDVSSTDPTALDYQAMKGSIVTTGGSVAVSYLFLDSRTHAGWHRTARWRPVRRLSLLPLGPDRLHARSRSEGWMILGFLATVALSAQVYAAEVGINGQGHASNPAWSPDGQYLAFEMNTFGGQIDLYVVKVQDGNPVGTPQQVKLPGATSSFAAGGSIAVAPTWHPQGRLIFEGSSKGGTNRLYDWAPGGSGATELLNSAQIKGDLSWPTIRKDGGAIAFVSDAAGLGDIYVWERSTNKVTSVLASPFTESSPHYGAGDTMAYSRKNRGTEDLFTLQEGRSVPLIGGNGDQTRPTWAGSKVVYFSNERGDEHWDVVVSAGPGDKTVLAKDVRLPDWAAPAISPDGQWVAYGLSSPAKDDKIEFTRIDGSSTVEVDTGLVACGDPAMVEAGGRWYLAFTALPSEGSDWRRLHIMDITGKL